MNRKETDIHDSEPADPITPRDKFIASPRKTPDRFNENSTAAKAPTTESNAQRLLILDLECELKDMRERMNDAELKTAGMLQQIQSEQSNIKEESKRLGRQSNNNFADPDDIQIQLNTKKCSKWWVILAVLVLLLLV